MCKLFTPLHLLKLIRSKLYWSKYRTEPCVCLDIQSQVVLVFSLDFAGFPGWYRFSFTPPIINFIEQSLKRCAANSNANTSPGMPQCAAKQAQLRAHLALLALGCLFIMAVHAHVVYTRDGNLRQLLKLACLKGHGYGRESPHTSFVYPCL